MTDTQPTSRLRRILDEANGLPEPGEKTDVTTTGSEVSTTSQTGITTPDRLELLQQAERDGITTLRAGEIEDVSSLAVRSALNGEVPLGSISAYRTAAAQPEQPAPTHAESH
jgi:hypothetical protein